MADTSRAQKARSVLARARLPGLVAGGALAILFGLWLGDALTLRWIGAQSPAVGTVLRASTILLTVLAWLAVAFRIARAEPASSPDATGALGSGDARAISNVILANAADGVLVWDPGEVVRYASPSAERLFGRRAEDLVGRSLAQVLADPPAAHDAIAEAVRGGGIVPLLGLRRDGAQFPLELTATPAQLSGAEACIGVFRDGSERLRAERAIRRSESVRDLIDHVSEAIVVHHAGRILYANRAASEALGYAKPEELIGTSLFEHVDPDQRAAEIARLQAMQRTGRPAPAAEERFVRRDGTSVCLEVTGVPMVFDGEPSVALLARDVAQQRDLLARVALADRLTSVGTLAAGVAHGINNPLTYVIANLTYAVDELDTRLGVHADGGLAELRLVLDQAREGAERIRDLVRDLVTFSGQKVTERIPVDVHAVLESALQLASNEIRHRARVDRSFGPTPPVGGDPAHLAHAFLNLLLNAAEAIPEGDAEQAVIRVATATDAAGNAIIEIVDSGCGIPESRVGRVFEPFYTTKPAGTGTGLGLSIARGIVAALGGELALESQVGTGTTARVVLRPAETDEAAGTGTPRPEHAPRPRVLVVDDEPAVRSLLRRMLRKDFDVDEAAGGREALERLDAGGRYDAILCDLLMPRMTGMDLYERLVDRHPEHARRMIFLTGGAFTPRARAFLESVASPRLEKPMRREQLRAALDAMLAR